MRGSIVPKNRLAGNEIQLAKLVIISYGLRFVLMLIATVASLGGLLRKPAAKEHVEKFFSRKLGLEASCISVFMLTEAALVEAVVAAHKLLLVFSVEIIGLSFFGVCENGDSVANGLESFD